MGHIRRQFSDIGLAWTVMLGLALVGTDQASASLVFDQTLDLQGTGIGAVSTILTI